MNSALSLFRAFAIIPVLVFLAAPLARAQKNIQKDSSGNITENLTIGSGKTLRVAPGATLNVTDATLVGFPTGSGLGDLISTNNLSDVEDVTAAFNNLSGVTSTSFGRGLLAETSATTARTTLSAAKTGANSDLTSTTALNTITAASSTDLSLQAGSSGSRLILREGTGGYADLTGKLLITTTTGTAIDATATFVADVNNVDGFLITTGTSITVNGSLDLFGFSSQHKIHSIPAGVTDSGQRTAITGDAYSISSSFAGTLATNIGVRGRAGFLTAASGAQINNAYGGYFFIMNSQAGATIDNAYGLYVENDEAVGTINHRYGIVVAGVDAMNIFAGKTAVGALATYKFNVDTAASNDRAIDLRNHSSAGTLSVGLFATVDGSAETNKGIVSDVTNGLTNYSYDSPHGLMHNTDAVIFDSTLTVNGTTQSTTKDTGAVIIEGGVGIEKNLNVGGTTTTTGNATAGNFTTAGLVTATGNVSGGNVTTGGIVTATGNITGGNVTTGGVVIATGNIAGGNITTAGVVAATGNVSGGNVTSTGSFLNTVSNGDPVLQNIASGLAQKGIRIATTNGDFYFYIQDHSSTFFPAPVPADASTLFSPTQPIYLATTNVTATGNIIVTSNLTVSGTTQSTTKDTGAVIVEGGVGIEKNIFAGGNITAAGTVNGTNLITTAAAEINALSSKATPTTSDLLVIEDAAASNAKKKVTVDGILAANDARSKTLTNTTLDASGTGNTLKTLQEIQLNFPAQVDNTGATRVTTEGATYGHATFSNSADKAGNYVLYRLRVPADLDTNVDLTATFTFRLGNTDTGKHAYEISMADVADSAGADSPTFSNAVALNFAGDASGASGDNETVGPATLTSWKGSLSTGHILVVKLARDGDDGTNDTSTVNSTDVNLTLKYGSTQ